MNPSSTVEAVLSIIREVLDHEIKEADDFLSLGGDSVKAIEIIGRIEEDLDVEFDMFLIWESKSLLDFATQIARRLDPEG